MRSLTRRSIFHPATKKEECHTTGTLLDGLLHVGVCRHVLARPSPELEVKLVGEIRPIHLSSSFTPPRCHLDESVRLLMPSRQERRRAERDAAKRAAQAGATAPAAALVTVSTNPGGDWTTQEGDPNLLRFALGTDVMKQEADKGAMAAGADTRPLSSST
jgi:hypothetical protein